MKKAVVLFGVMALVALGASGVWGADIGLYEYGGNINGTIYSSGPYPAYTFPGDFSVTVSGAGAYNILGFFDFEIDEALNTYFNEYGTAYGTPAAGLSWEIDDPLGDIYANFLSGTLDNSNGVPSAPSDVAFALGWNFNLLSGQSALVSFLVSGQAPAGGFYLSQTDPDSGATFYLASSLKVSGGGGTTVPEPGTLALLAAGLVGLAGFSRRRRTKA